MPHRTSPSPPAKGNVGKEMFQVWGSLSGTPGPRNYFGLKIKSSLCPLSLSCYQENRKPGFVFTHAPPPRAPTEPPHAALLWPLVSLPFCLPGQMILQKKPHAWQALPFPWRSQFTLPHVPSLPSTQGFNQCG